MIIDKSREKREERRENGGNLVQCARSTLKVRLVKALVLPVMTYGCESWEIKKSERRKIGAFELWCWRRSLGIPWTERRTNKSILDEIRPETSLEGMIIKRALIFLGHTTRAS